MNDLALLRRLPDVVAEYETKLANIDEALSLFKRAGADLEMACTIGGTFGRERLDIGSIYEHTMRKNLLKSAWLHIYDGLNIKMIASARDKNLFDQAIENPAPFTLENIKATFGSYIADPRGNILRGLAEVFCDLDPAYKSHDKVRIGVKGLPKRIILNGINGYGWGRDRLTNVLNALAAYQNKPLVSWNEGQDLIKDGECMRESRGVWLKKYANGNGHLYFDDKTLRDINMALAEYYGEVLPDCSEAKPEHKQESTAVAKDLQYYPTPQKVIERIINGMGNISGFEVLEPSCGCGRIMDAFKERGAHVFGIEVDYNRAQQAKSKHHSVINVNFLDVYPDAKYDIVVMNPPFYGQHYAKHVKHAMKFLKERGQLIAILPVTARYDHGLLDEYKGRWEDLPVGSFKESGTNINTTIFTWFK